jgi:MFS family permease
VTDQTFSHQTEATRPSTEPSVDPTAAIAGPTTRRRALAGVATLAMSALGGLLAGAVGAAFFRWFMRYVSTDPEFSWSGTMAIIIIFAFFGTVQGLALGARRVGLRRRWLTPFRLLGAVGLLGTMAGAGVIMAATVMGGGLAAHRPDWPRPARIVAGAAAVANLVAVAVMTAQELGGWSKPLVAAVWLTVIYALIVAGAGPTLSPQADAWKLAPPLRRAGIIAAVLVAAGMGLAVTGLRA